MAPKDYNRKTGYEGNLPRSANYKTTCPPYPHHLEGCYATDKAPSPDLAYYLVKKWQPFEQAWEYAVVQGRKDGGWWREMVFQQWIYGEKRAETLANVAYQALLDGQEWSAVFQAMPEK